MACMEHECGECGLWWFDNRLKGPCPDCGSKIVISKFDEDFNTSE
jgi:predicted  nucleic acid-binding Zn-ribbon protein